MSGNLQSKLRSFWSRAGLVLAWAVLAGVPGSSAGAEEACWIRGDADGTGSVDLSDVMAILNRLYFANECVSPAGDVNDNGYVTIADPLYILHWQFTGRLSAPAAPFPECGVDPTSGSYGFGAPNPDYGIRSSFPTVLGNRVLYQLEYRSVSSLLGLSLGFEIAPGPVLKQVRLEADFLDPADKSIVSILPETEFRNQSAIITSVHPSPRGGNLLPSTDWEWRDLGILVFEFEEAAVPAAILWKPEVDLGGCVFRATMVNGTEGQDPVTDHYPTFFQETEPRGFRRGSAGFNEVISWLWSGGEAPLDCRDRVDPDAADNNDNEALTLADALIARASVAGRIDLPAPALLCGLDRSEDRRGFDQVDGSFRLTAGQVAAIRGGSGRVTEVHIPLSVDVPVDLTAAQFILEYDATALEPFEAGEGGAFSGVTGSTLVKKVENGDRSLLIIGVYVEDDGRTLRAADPGAFARIGTLHFHLRDFAVFRPIRWIPEVEADGRLYRASLVDADFNDHHPQLLVGEYRFVRGNSNSDEFFDISDGIFTSEFLFMGGRAPDCFDAADANNDGELDVSDPIFTYSSLFMGGPLPPEPYPQCGLDTETIDLLDCSPPTGRNACR